MKKLLILVMTATLAAPAWAADGSKNNLTIVAEPMVRLLRVDGDEGRFSAHHWMQSPVAGGIREFDAHYKLNDELTLTSAGHAIFGENDYGTELRLDREDGSYLLFEYDEYRKYYDRTGGKYHPFTFLETVEAMDDLFLDIGEIKAEAHLKKPAPYVPNLTFTYMREFREGTKSRLTWASVSEDVSKNIGPSWQDLDEKTDTFRVKFDDTFKGYDWHAVTQWDFFDSDSRRYERAVSINTTASQKKRREQVLNPSSDIFTTNLGAERWFRKDTVFLASGYRYSQIDNQELENMFEFNELGVITNFSNPDNVRDATATNQFSANSWVGHGLWKVWEPFTVIGRLKAERVERDSSSKYPKDRSPNAAGGAIPDGQIDELTSSEVDNYLRRIGESISLRWTGIPKTAVYTDFEAEQTRNRLIEDRISSNTGENFSRESIGHLYRGSGTLGFQTWPWQFIRLTGHLRHRRDDINYNDVYFTDNSTAGAKSVFIDGQDIITDEAAAKLTLKPCRWFQPSFRYQRQDKDYLTWGLPDDQNKVESRQLSDTYTLDLSFVPTDRWIGTFSWSFQDAYTKTAAASFTSTAQAPLFNSDVQSWFADLEYQQSEKVTWDTSFRYSRANNFNDFTSFGLPLGADYNEWEASLGVKWKARPDLTVEPKFAVYGYNPNDMADSGQYNAYVGWLQFTYSWS